MNKRLDITEKYLERFATGTLAGTILSDDFKLPEEVTLVFPRATLSWCRDHGGPPQWVINEFVIPILLEDMARLQAKGVKFTIVYEERNP